MPRYFQDKITHFHFDGEFNVASRRMIEFIEKPNAGIGEVMFGYTNEPECRSPQNNEFITVIRSKTLEMKRFKVQKDTITGKHMALHTTGMAATWDVLVSLKTRITAARRPNDEDGCCSFRHSGGIIR